MAQDTRKDTRAPVSLKVRFKSATVDEFIEQYSTDISRGGIFIKSKSPMPVGTLLKFEFELKDNSPLIHGVGRVVWKRDPDPAKPDMQPGMGIKFIKMDSPSRAVVERIVGGRAEAGEDRVSTPARPQPAVRAASSELGEGDEDQDQLTMVSKVPELMAQQIAQMPAGQEMPIDVAAAARAGIPTPPPLHAVAHMPPPPAQPTAEASAPVTLSDLDAPLAQLPVLPGASAPPSGHTMISAVPPPPDVAPASAGAASWGQVAPDVEDEADAIAYEPEPPPPSVTVRASSPAMAAIPGASAPAALILEEPKRNPIIYVMVAILVLGTALFLLTQRGDRPARGREARARGDSGRVEPPRAKAAAVTPTSAHEDPVAPTKAAEAAPAAVATARIHVETTPAGAEVWLGTTSKGRGPIDLEVPAGEAATIKARRAGYREASEQVTPTAGAASTVSLTLQALPRVLAITSEPSGASISIGGRSSGKTPRDVTLDEVNGPIEVRLTRNGSQPFERAIAAEEGWREVDGRYRYELTATLTEATRSPRARRNQPAAPRPPTAGAEPPPSGNDPQPGAPEPPPPAAAPEPPPPPPPSPSSPVPDNPFGK